MLKILCLQKSSLYIRTMKTNKHGGARPNSGRPKKTNQTRVISFRVQDAATAQKIREIVKMQQAAEPRN
jgi:hypothetical protein